MILATETELTPAHFSIEQAAHVAPWSDKVFRQCLGVGYVIRSLYVPAEHVSPEHMSPEHVSAKPALAKHEPTNERTHLSATDASTTDCRAKEWRLAGYYVAHTVADEVTLMNIAVDPALQGKGYGAVLLNDLIGRCADLQGELRARLFLEVRESNESALRLYYRYGFSEVGRRPGYYPAAKENGSPETAIVMARLPLED